MRKDLFAGLWCPKCRYHICRCGGSALAQLMELPHNRGQELRELATAGSVTLDDLRATTRTRLCGWPEDEQ